jgi:hypothetical protein
MLVPLQVTIPCHALIPRLGDKGCLHVGFNADTLAPMKQAVCVLSVLARFTMVVLTGLWAIDGVAAFHSMGTARGAVAGAVSATDLPAGFAKGLLTYDGTNAELKFAAAFVDQKDERKPIVLVISDQKLPVEKWESEFDMMMDHSKWSGVVFFLDKDGKFFRSDVHMNGRQSSVSGIFELKIDNPSSKDLIGIARTSADEKETKLDAAFHATLE